MIQDSHNADSPELERQLLEHFRAHSKDEPSAALDARILLAARAAPRPAELKSHWSQRLHTWLFGAGSRQRWSMAVAGLACLGIGLSLTWRSVEQVPGGLDAPPVMESAPAPAAPAVQAYSMPAPVAVPQKSSEFSGAADAQVRSAPSVAAEAKQEARTERLAEQVSGALGPEQAKRKATEAEAMADMVAQVEPQTSLRRLLELRRVGKSEEAERLLQTLRRDYPQLDIEAEVQRLMAQPSEVGR